MYKYEKSTWINGETILKAEHMQKIEQGIVDLQEELENVKVGDIDLSNFYNKIEVDEKDVIHLHTVQEVLDYMSHQVA